MGTRHPNYRRVKVHLTYTIEDLSRLFGLHKNTVRGWQTAGLRPVDNGRPILFKGGTVADFLKQRRESAKQPCGPGRLYCLPCRTPQRPAGGMVDYIPSTQASGMLCGICPECERYVYRRVSRARIGVVAAGLNVQFPKAEPRIGEWRNLPVKCDLDNGDPQP